MQRARSVIWGSMWRAGVTAAVLALAGCGGSSVPQAATPQSATTQPQSSSTTTTTTSVKAGTGEADVSWTPPTTAADGSTLLNLAGYDIYYGASLSALTQQVQVTNIGVTNYVISGLTSGTWYFVVTSYTTDGTQSVPSNVVNKAIP